MYEKIKKLIEMKGENANSVSKKTKIPAQLFSIWKQGKAKPSLENLEKLATYFDVPITYFFTGEIIEKQQTNFSNEDLILAREINKSEKIELIKDIIRIQKESDINMLKEMTKIFLERK